MRLGAYEVEKEVGRGGAAVVYRARDGAGRVVALKVLRFTPESPDRERFEREKRLLASLGEAEGFVPLIDAGSFPQGEFVVMPFVPGGTLRERLRRGRLGVDESVELVLALARALGRAHARGIVHRDLKPENILFAADGRALVADLGLAKQFRKDTPGASQSVALSRTGEFRGTAGYMPPEQMSDLRSAGPAADVFALGAILHECITGEPAFQGQTVMEALAQVLSGSVTPLRALRPDTPRWLEAIVARALAPAPERRFADGADLASALEAKRGSAAGGRGRLLGVAALLGVGALLGLGALAGLGLLGSGSPAARPRPLPGVPVGSGAGAEHPPPPPTAPTRPLGEPAPLQPDASFPELCRGFLSTPLTRLLHVRGDWRWKCAAKIRAVVPLPDGARAITADEDGIVRLWGLSAHDGHEAGEALATLTARGSPVCALSLSPDARRLLAGNAEGEILLVEVASARVLARLTGHRGEVFSVAFSPDGDHALSAGADGTPRVWDLSPLARGEPVPEPRVLSGHQGPLRAVAYLPDGLRACTGGDDRTVRVWDLSTGETLALLGEHTASVTALAAAAEGGALFSGCEDRAVRLWNPELGTLVGRETGDSIPRSLACAPTGEGLLVGSEDGSVRLWRFELGRGDREPAVSRSFPGPTDATLAVAFSSDGKRVLAAGADKKLRVWDRAGGASLSLSGGGHESAARVAVVSPDGTRVLSGSWDRTALLWDRAGGRELARLSGHDGPVPAVAFSPDGRCALTGSFDRTLKLWELPSGRLLRTLSGHEGFVNGVAFLPDGRRAVSAGFDNAVRLWDVSTGCCLATLEGHTNAVFHVAVLPGGRRALSSGADGTVRVWDLEAAARGQPALERTLAHGAESACVVPFPDGRRALSMAFDHTLKAWDLVSGEPLATIVASGHERNVYMTSLSPDGKVALSQSREGRIKLWDVDAALRGAGRVELDTVDLASAQDWAEGVAFAPDGRSFVAATVRGVVLELEVKRRP